MQSHLHSFVGKSLLFNSYFTATLYLMYSSHEKDVFTYQRIQILQSLCTLLEKRLDHGFYIAKKEIINNSRTEKLWYILTGDEY